MKFNSGLKAHVTGEVQAQSNEILHFLHVSNIQGSSCCVSKLSSIQYGAFSESIPLQFSCFRQQLNSQAYAETYKASNTYFWIV